MRAHGNPSVGAAGSWQTSSRLL